LVPDLDSGLALWRQNGVHVTMVTPDGDVVDATGVITGGSERPLEEEMVSRRRLASELTAVIAAEEERLEGFRAQVEKLRREMDEQEAALKNLDHTTHALTLQLVAGEKDLERLEGERPRWLDRLELARFESNTARDEEAARTVDLQKTEQELLQLHAQREALEADLRSAQERAALATACVDELQGALTGIKVRVAERRQRQEAAVTALVRLSAQREELTSRAAAVAAELQETRHEHTDLQTAVQQAETQRAAQESARQITESEIIEARAALESASAALAEHDRRVQETRAQLDGLRDRAAQCEIAVAEKRLRAQQLAENVREKYGAELGGECSPLPSEDEQQAVARLETLRDKLARIGEVNTGAIEELQELEQRAQFLRTQKEDLDRSLADLERTIQRLNRASRTRFAETFAAVNEKFQSVLPRLFRGGEARLILTDEHNLLETGVEIVVRPPGKRLDTVTLLSGGEKALVAVSLIFSLFLINPTPFCFLDEVDAPLDDANIGRFTNLVRETSAHSQFIVITHNKRTMQAADVLYGVTMEEAGLSKTISVAMH